MRERKEKKFLQFSNKINEQKIKSICRNNICALKKRSFVKLILRRKFDTNKAHDNMATLAQMARATFTHEREEKQLEFKRVQEEDAIESASLSEAKIEGG